MRIFFTGGSGKAGMHVVRSTDPIASWPGLGG